MFLKILMNKFNSNTIHLNHNYNYFFFKMASNEMKKNLKILYKLCPRISDLRKKSMIEFFTHKTDKIHLLFENISNPMNVVNINFYFSMLVLGQLRTLV